LQPNIRVVGPGLGILAVVLGVTLAVLSSVGGPAEATGPQMSLRATGPLVQCNDSANPTKCSAAPGTPFTLSVAVESFPAGGYPALQTQISYPPSGLTYKPVADLPGGTDEGADAEIVWPDAHIQVRDLSGVPGGVLSHGSVTGPPGSPGTIMSTYTGDVVRITMNCSAGSSSVVSLPPFDAAVNPFGSAFFDTNGNGIVPKTTGGYVDQLTINCVVAAPTVPATPQPKVGPKMFLDAKSAGCTAVPEPICDVTVGSITTLSVILSQLNLPDVDGDTAAGYLAFQARGSPCRISQGQQRWCGRTAMLLRPRSPSRPVRTWLAARSDRSKTRAAISAPY